MSKAQVAILVILAVALAISVVTDLRSRKIKNVVTLPTIALCLALRLASEGWGGWTTGLASGLLGMSLGFLPFWAMGLAGGMGMGDVKLMAAVGAAVGFPMVIACLICVAIAGGVQAILQLLWDGLLMRTLGGMGKAVLAKARLTDKPAELTRKKIPYGVAIAVGTVWAVAWAMTQSEVPPT